MNNLKDCVLITTITKECKNDLGNDDKFYDGIWEVRVIDYREQTVELCKKRLCIFRKFSEINDITIKK